MRYALSLKAFAGLFALVAAGCSSGSDGTASAHIRCSSGDSFCLISCDLGCSQTGCAVSEIAENQRLKFTFSKSLDVASINGSSVSLRTARGVPPEGEIRITNNELTFVPSVRTANGVSSFGFRRNETYIISLAGGTNSAFGVRSIDGDTLGADFTCTVVASRGIVDEDQRAPTVTMIAPTNLSEAPRDPSIVLRFSELIDTTPLRGTLTPASPVRVTLRTAENNNGVLTCNSSSGLVLEGIPTLSTERVADVDVTVVEFKAPVTLPGLACVEVAVTSDLRDLSGRPAIANRFEFFTEAGEVIPITVAEGFASPTNMEVRTSGVQWNNGARPGTLGGDGRHGSFDYTQGTAVSSTEFTFDTTSIDIPASQALNGQPETVTNGVLYFTDFMIPEGVKVNFVGPVPPQIHVRGQVDIGGEVRLNGARMLKFAARGGTSGPAPFINGQPGGIGGAGGGRGGKGGDECQGNGPIVQNGVILTNGQPGEDVRLLAGNGYAPQSANTGGRGSVMNPPAGDNNFSPFPGQILIGNVYRAYFAPGGSGGGFSGAGSAATAGTLPNLQLGPIPAVGAAFDIASYAVGNSNSSLEHYTIGGSGGGGGATHNFGTIYISQDVYTAGAGGSGGGGACALRAGGDVNVAATAVFEAKGGAGVNFNGLDNNNTPTALPLWGICSPGGGGSGGSFLIQSGGNLSMAGTIDTSGGNGSSTGGIVPSTLNLFTQAGAGANGFFRLEAEGTLSVTSASTIPAYVAGTHSGTLASTEKDPLTGCTSRWYPTAQILPPTWLRYEITVDLDGPGGPLAPHTFTDDPNNYDPLPVSSGIKLEFQGARLLQSTGLPDPLTIGPWRPGVAGATGISADSPTGLRFMLTFDSTISPDCVVQGLVVHAQG
ncbi:MAG: hypothetical protein KDC98_23805 [Planctomycetes bacterium]|nr:hypothetical protein [Planctomycetota bacterium]